VSAGGSQNFLVRQAKLSDAGTVQRISAEAYTAAYLAAIGAVPKPATEDYRPRIERNEVWILESDGEPRGIVVLEARPEILQVYSVAVRPEHQGKGYATALLRFAEQHGLTTGALVVRLYTNQRMERNLALYRRCGFTEIGKRPHPSRPGETLVDMEKTLPAAR
jgi:ribosomal protein S18 acetylase RimI-like enzyme